VPKTRMSEADLTAVLVQAAQLYGYRVHHSRPAWSEKGWRTPVQGHRGLPDLVIAGHGLLLLAELKVGNGRLRPDQEVWRAAIPAENYRLWTDANLEEALDELRASRNRPTASGDHDARSQLA